MVLEAAAFPGRVFDRIVESNAPGQEYRIYRRPLGVVGAISPWNVPLHFSQRSVAPALALSNAVVIKPASDTPGTGCLMLARIFEEAGLPAGTLSAVVGARSEIGDDVVTNPVPGLISFVGSTPVGKSVRRLAAGEDFIKQIALELGGNGHFVVIDDADLDVAVQAAVLGKFLHQRQICMAVNRIIVQAPLINDGQLAGFSRRSLWQRAKWPKWLWRAPSTVALFRRSYSPKSPNVVCASVRASRPDHTH